MGNVHFDLLFIYVAYLIMCPIGLKWHPYPHSARKAAVNVMLVIWVNGYY